MKIPIKRYTPNEDVLRDIKMILAEQYGPDDPVMIKRLAEEFNKLLAHHEEETKFLIQHIEVLELVAKD